MQCRPEEQPKHRPSPYFLCRIPKFSQLFAPLNACIRYYRHGRLNAKIRRVRERGERGRWEWGEGEKGNPKSTKSARAERFINCRNLALPPSLPPSIPARTLLLPQTGRRLNQYNMLDQVIVPSHWYQTWNRSHRLQIIPTSFPYFHGSLEGLHVSISSGYHGRETLQ